MNIGAIATLQPMIGLTNRARPPVASQQTAPTDTQYLWRHHWRTNSERQGVFLLQLRGPATKESSPVTQEVPTDLYRAGNLQYKDPSNAVHLLTPAQVAQLDASCKENGVVLTGPDLMPQFLRTSPSSRTRTDWPQAMDSMKARINFHPLLRTPITLASLSVRGGCLYDYAARSAG
jgi:hypothetical protein